MPSKLPKMASIWMARHGQVRNADHATSGGSLGEELGVHLVDGVHVVHVLHEDVHLDAVLQDMVDALDDGLDVLESLLGLGLHAAGDQRARCRVNAELGGDVVVVGERHGLGGQLVLRSVGDVVGLDDQAMTGLDGLRRGAVAVGAHSLDLHERVLRQVGDLDHGAGRQVVDGAGDAESGKKRL